MCTHGFQFAPDAHGYVVTLGYPLIERLAKNLTDVVHLPGQPRVLPVAKPERARLAACFACLHAEYQGTREHRSSIMDAMLTSLMIWISRQLSDEAAAQTPAAPAAAGTCTTPPSLNPAQRHLALFGELIEKHYQQYGSVAQYAAQIGITPAHLNVLCREQVGQSALSLIHQRRLLEAKRMLVYTAMNIHTISDALAFNNPAYFTRFFRRLTGLSPREFREQAADLLKPV